VTRLEAPSCLDELEAIRESADGAEEDDGFEVAHFALRCRCGGGAFRVQGYPDDSEPRSVVDRLVRTLLRGLREARVGLDEEEPAGLRGPIHLVCEACSRDVVVFDPRRDGRSARRGRSASVRETGLEAIRCRLCRRSSLRAVACFMYEPIRGLDAEPSEQRSSDDFDRVRLDATCDTCGNRTRVADLRS